MNINYNIYNKIFSNRCLKIWAPLSIHLFYFLRNILDPEYPLKIYFLKIISFERIFIQVFSFNQTISFDFIFIPTIKKCSLSPLLGIFLENKIYKIQIAKKLSEILPKIWNWAFFFEMPFYSHTKSFVITKQLNDKERITSALENCSIRRTIKKCSQKI
ncbi:hypothetical protein CMESO_129 (nucleomorph) [Chroomonas mesostigmatica CCMP1168]|uniref:Uncharacterized protein n=1 Tax=Chroomonas mesostigmatica CCMP1168 TaxID=1195612 RepID=J7GA07_9CRYP|nr:hypothetical protein CMESO_129 [Chroomonas mesostigmatica CCMP1168]